MKKLFFIFSIVFAITITSCKKPAGQGGNSSIQGKVHVTNYNSNFTWPPLGVYPGADVDVYIIYGDEISYGDRIKSGPDGVFEFQYLRKGSYKIYVYSKDSVATVATPPYSVLNPNLNAPKMAIVKSVDISKKKQTVNAGTIEIYN